MINLLSDNHSYLQRLYTVHTAYYVISFLTCAHHSMSTTAWWWSTCLVHTRIHLYHICYLSTHNCHHYDPRQSSQLTEIAFNQIKQASTWNIRRASRHSYNTQNNKSNNILPKYNMLPEPACSLSFTLLNTAPMFDSFSKCSVRLPHYFLTHWESVHFIHQINTVNLLSYCYTCSQRTIKHSKFNQLRLSKRRMKHSSH